MSCGYQGMHFGAPYEDGGCIGGYLWDLDSCDENDQLTSGGDIPCPGCNREKYIEMLAEQVEEDGWLQGNDGKPLRVPEFNKSFSAEERELFDAAWDTGWHDGIKAWEREQEKVKSIAEHAWRMGS